MSEKRKKLIFVTTRLPFPQNSGRKVSLYHYCRGLYGQYGYEIHLFVFPEFDQPRSDAGKPPFLEEIRFSHPIGRLTKFFNMLTRCFFGKNRWPFQCALYYSRKNKQALCEYIREVKPDAVIFDMIRTAPYLCTLRKTDIRGILDLDDLLSRRYTRQLENFDGRSGVAGRYAGQLPALTDRLLCHGVMGKAVLRAERNRVARAELFFGRQSDGVIFVSEKETETFNHLIGRELAVTVPLGVDCDSLEPARSRKKVPGRIGFIGNLSVAANRASLACIAREILPQLQADVTMEVIGFCPPELPAEYADVKKLIFKGTVPDLCPVAGQWQLLLAPVPFGSGIKTKILDAMAMGLPVVTDELGAEGIPAEDGKEIFIGRTSAEMAELTGRLLADPALCRQVGETAAAFARAHFSWEESFAAFGKLGL